MITAATVPPSMLKHLCTSDGQVKREIKSVGAPLRRTQNLDSTEKMDNWNIDISTENFKKYDVVGSMMSTVDSE